MAMTLQKTKAAADDEDAEMDHIEALVAERVAKEVARLEEERAASVTEEVKKQLAELTATLTLPGAATNPDGAMLASLAEAIYAVNNNDQEIGRRRVPPEELAKRTRAREEMEKLISATRDLGTQPVYLLTRKCYLGEQIIEPYWVDRATRTVKPTEIGWWGIPNEFMHPVNAEAEAIHNLFLESIDSHKKVDRSQRVTPGGLVVRSGGLNPDGGRDSAPRVGRDVNEPSLKGRNGDRPEVMTRILGTLMPPARQMV